MIRIRCLVLWALGTVVAGAAVRWTTATGLAGVAADRVDQVVVGVAALALSGCLGWAWAVTSVVVAQAVRDGAAPRRRPRGVPAWAVRVVAAACGAAVLAGAPAHADVTDLTDVAEVAGSVVPRPTTTVDGLPFPDRPVGPAHPARPAHREIPDRSTRSVTVAPGGSLWRVSADRLPDASDAEVARATAALYDLNRDRVGADPDLVHPGERLRLPDVLLDTPPSS